jgi:hypothetical protein
LPNSVDCSVPGPRPCAIAPGSTETTFAPAKREPSATKLICALPACNSRSSDASSRCARAEWSYTKPLWSPKVRPNSLPPDPSFASANA